MDWINIDHRRGIAFAPGDLEAYLRSSWELTPNLSMYVEAVRRLNEHGAVITHTAHGTSEGGSDAEWRSINLVTVDEGRVNRCEIFDESDVDAALARFDELYPRTTQLENAASRASDRYIAHFVARDWNALAEVMAENITIDDRRPLVNVGIRQGRDSEIANLRAAADVGITDMESSVIATRGERLVLSRLHWTASGDVPQRFHLDALCLAEIDAEGRLAAFVAFDTNDFDSAIAALDARYIAGDAAPYAHTWSVLAPTYAAVSRGELPLLTPDCVTIDHRRAAAFAPGELTAYIRAGADVKNVRLYAEVVHRLDELGAVCTYASQGVSREGFDAEWRGIALTTLEDDKINRTEMFDEADIDAALARFDELHLRTGRRENAATLANAQFLARFAASDWRGMTAMLAEDIDSEDRRRVVNAGLQQGRDFVAENYRLAAAELGITQVRSEAVATRGSRLVLARTRLARGDEDPAPFHVDLLQIVEVDVDGLIAAFVTFEGDDFDSATSELDARYLAGEAAPYSHTWSVIARGYSAFNRREAVPIAPDWVNIDHRRGVSVAPGELTEYFSAAWDLEQDVSIYIEDVHCLSTLGAVITHATHATSQQGFDGEWRFIELVTIDGEMVNRAELFDEADLDTAIAKFEQLHPKTLSENAASRAAERATSHFPHDWDVLQDVMVPNISVDDRRHVVNAGLRVGRDKVAADLGVVADLGMTKASTAVIATRGERLALCRFQFTGDGVGPEAVEIDVLAAIGVNSDGRATFWVSFDADDVDAAFAELDARYLAGEAAPYANTWSVIAREYSAFNRHEPPAMTPNCVTADHRSSTSFPLGDFTAYLRAGWDLEQVMSFYIEAVHRLSDVGGVFTGVGKSTSRAGGIDAEWRTIDVVTCDGDKMSRRELFDEAELDAALTRFEELSAPTTRMENATSRVYAQFLACFRPRDWDGMARLLADDLLTDDRRRVVNAGVQQGRDTVISDMRAAAAVGVTNFSSTTMATRGTRLALVHIRVSGRDQDTAALLTEIIGVVEIDADNQLTSYIAFDTDDIDAAFAELDARYHAGEAAAYSQTWSVIARAMVEFNRGQLSSTDLVTVDHRRATPFTHGDLTTAIPTVWDFTPDISTRIEVVHRLSSMGAVLTYATDGSTKDGFGVEWRGIHILTVEGDRIDRCELFDEADLETALVRFDELHTQTPIVENAASRVNDRFDACFAARDWDGMAELLTDDFSSDDRRPVINAGRRIGRDIEIANMQAVAGIGTATAKSVVIATRGDRLALSRTRFSGPDQDPDAFHTDILDIVETDDKDRIAARVAFDPDKIEAAFAELDARYLAGEAAAHAHTWSVITEGYTALNRREMPRTTPDWVNIDHRRAASFAPGEMPALLENAWKFSGDLSNSIEAVHRLDDLGAVITHASHETSQDGFDAEWRVITVMTIEGDLVDRCEVFDDVDLEAALARFDELHSRTRLHNAASQVYERFFACFTVRDWRAMADLLAEDICQDDRRPVVNSGIRRGRDVEISDMHALADLGVTDMTSTVVATRGERLALCRVTSLTFQTEVLNVVEIDANERILAVVGLGIDDLDAALEELDGRYLAGEAAPHAHMWSLTTAAFAAINRHEVPTTTDDYVIVDHQLQHTTVEARGLAEYLRASWDLTPDLRMYIEAVHRLSDAAVVITLALHGTSAEGLDADWRIVELLTAEGDLGKRCEVFAEANLDTALARFDELQTQKKQLDNAASRVDKRFAACFGTRNWEAMADLADEAIVVDDRRHVVNAGLRRGRDAEIANMRARAETGVQKITPTTVAIRGQRLALMLVVLSAGDQLEAFHTEALGVVEINADNRVIARAVFDIDDIDAAFAELDARYLVGEAAAHAHVWSRVMDAYAALNRRELPATAPDAFDLDHRRLAPIGQGDLRAYLRAVWELSPHSRVYVEAVHRVSGLGALVTHVVNGTSREGFDAEWRMIVLLTFDGDLITRSELFDEDNLDGALTRFGELHGETRRLNNTATEVYKRYAACFSARDSAGMADTLADDLTSDDRRRVVNAGIRRGRDENMADMRASADVGVTDIFAVPIAIRGNRLALLLTRGSGQDKRPEAYHSEMLHVIEVNAEHRISAAVVFDSDALSDAFAELEARYLAGERAAHAHTWSVASLAYASMNRGEMASTTKDFVHVNHRLRTTIGAEDLTEYLRAAWNDTPDLSICVEEVHRLSDLGSIVTSASYGNTQDGFHVEWRMVEILTVEGDLISRSELFDEEDLDTALARFDELHSQPQELENAASRVDQRISALFATRDWEPMVQLMAEGISVEDRRHVVNAGLRRGRDAEMANIRARAGVGVERITSTVLAMRGERLALSRTRFSGRDQRPEELLTEALCIVEIDTEERVVARVGFDVDDIDAAFEELDNRYLAGEAAPYADLWSLVARNYAALNRRELPADMQDWQTVDHRVRETFEGRDLTDYIRSGWDVAPDVTMYIEAVHRLSNVGAVVTHVATGTSPDGLEAEWRMIEMLVVAGESNRCEIFDEADYDGALARFDEIDEPAPSLENAATQRRSRIADAFNRRDADGIIAGAAADARYEDRRKGLRDEGQARPEVARAFYDAAPSSWQMETEPIAVRGAHLALTRDRFRDNAEPNRPITTEILAVTEVGHDGLFRHNVSCDPDDVDAAFEELENRYLAGEAAAHAHTWKVIIGGYAALNRQEFPATTPDWVNVDHRRGIAFAAGDTIPYVQATWELAPDFKLSIEAVHRLSDLGAVVTWTARGTSEEGVDAEWRGINFHTVEGDLISRGEVFDEEDLDAAVARFEELNTAAPALENAATRARWRVFDALTRRDVDGLLALAAADARYDDRRKVLRDEGQVRPDVIRTIFDATRGMQLETKPFAVRGSRLALTHDEYRDAADPNRPITAEHLTLTEIGDDGLVANTVLFDLDDGDAAFEELDARWVALGEVSHPEVIASVQRFNKISNRHDWDAIATTLAGAAYVSHRQLAHAPNDTIDDYMSSIWTLASLVPDYWCEVAEVVTHSAAGLVAHTIVKGTSTDGAAIEIPLIQLVLLDGDRVTRVEFLDLAQRDLALARFEELKQPT